MAQNSKIEWCEMTWNPLAGCTRASEGCDNCYAAKMSLRLEAMAERDIADGRDPGGKAKYIGIATKNGKGVAVFNGKINLDMNALHEPISWKKPRMIMEAYQCNCDGCHGWHLRRVKKNIKKAA